MRIRRVCSTRRIHPCLYKKHHSELCTVVIFCLFLFDFPLFPYPGKHLVLTSKYGRSSGSPDICEAPSHPSANLLNNSVAQRSSGYASHLRTTAAGTASASDGIPSHVHSVPSVHPCSCITVSTMQMYRFFQ